MCCFVTLDIIVFSTVINKNVPICVPMIKIYTAVKIALSDLKLKPLLNKKYPKRFDVAD